MHACSVLVGVVLDIYIMIYYQTIVRCILQWWTRQIISIDWTVESTMMLSLRPTLIDMGPYLRIRYIHMAEWYTAICQLDDMLLVSCESISMHIQLALHSIKVCCTCTHAHTHTHR